MPIAYEIHCPKDVDDVRMYNWNMEVLFNDGEIGSHDIYGDMYEMLNWCYHHMDTDNSIVRIHIWRGLTWWGEMERI